MVERADIGTAVGATAVRDSRPATVTANAKDPSGDPLSRWLVVIPVGCLLMAMVCAAALSRLASVPAIASSAAPIDQETERTPDVPTIYEVEGGDSLLRFGPAFTR